MLLATVETEEEIDKVVMVEQMVQEKQEEMDQEDLEGLITQQGHYQQREFSTKDSQDVLRATLILLTDFLLVNNSTRCLRGLMDSTSKQHQEAPTL